VYITDEKGKWKVYEDVKILIEPSIDYLNKKESEIIEQEKLEALIPTPEEIEQADFEVKSINLLSELGVI